MKHTNRLVSYGVLVVSLVLAGWLFAHRQYVADQLLVWQYDPSKEVAVLATDSGMSHRGEFYYYASQPMIEGTQVFNQHCARQEKQSAILGCYNTGKIYVYDVTNHSLKGIKAVTAAHEMLHAAYDRLDDDAKQRIDGLLEKQFKTLNDDELNQRMAYYERTEPTERLNELHSIIGTEYSDIDDELADYYGEYFSNRQKVVSAYQSYAAVFNGLQDQSDSLVAQLKTLAAKINGDTAQYNKDVKQLKADIASFNSRAKNGSFASRSEFDAQKAGLIDRSRSLNAIRSAINRDIDRYNDLKDQLEAINSRSQALNNSIDSTLAPAPAL